MSDTSKKSENPIDGGVNSIQSVIDVISAAFKAPKQPVTPLPPPLLMIGGKQRSGVTPSEIASRIIARQSEAGLVVGNVYEDGPNTAEAMELIRVEEIINSLLTEGKIEIVIPPGVRVMTVGTGNLGAPVVSQGATTDIAVGYGVIR